MIMIAQQIKKKTTNMGGESMQRQQFHTIETFNSLKEEIREMYLNQKIHASLNVDQWSINKDHIYQSEKAITQASIDTEEMWYKHIGNLKKVHNELYKTLSSLNQLKMCNKIGKDRPTIKEKLKDITSLLEAKQVELDTIELSHTQNCQLGKLEVQHGILHITKHTENNEKN